MITRTIPALWACLLLGCSDGATTPTPGDAGVQPDDAAVAVDVGGGPEDSGCVESDTEFCTRVSAVCGSVAAPDACGRSRVVTCGQCTESKVCSSTFQCVSVVRWQRTGGGLSFVSYEGVVGSGANTFALQGNGTLERLGPMLTDRTRAAMLPPESNGLFGRGSTFYAFGYGYVTRYTGMTASRVGNIVGEVKALNGSGTEDLWAAMLTGGLRHWDGTAWSYNSDIDLPGGANSDVRGLYSFSASDAWAVGTNSGAFHWDGTAWVRTPTGLDSVTLLGVWGSAPGDVWAVGGISVLSRTQGYLIRYRSGRWSRSEVPSITAVRAIHGLSASDVWAVGDDGLILHFNGTRWENQSIAGTTEDFYGVWAQAADDVWAVGSGGIIAHYGL